ncbi:acyltransferase [Blautia sp. HCP3S3_H10_1]|uniref:acyltransferase n=1 Tax=unclassified Blautia TaxID=2648079 RepID=UPI003F93E7E9
MKYKKDLFIHPLSVVNARKGSCSFHEGVSLKSMTRIDCSEKGMVELGEFASLNTGTRIEAEESVVLGKYVTTGPYVYISDRSHEYRDIYKPIIRQGYFSRGGYQSGMRPGLVYTHLLLDQLILESTVLSVQIL